MSEFELIEGYIETGQFEKALGSINQLDEEEVTNQVIYLRAYANYCAMNLDQAQVDLEELIGKDTEHEEAYYYLSQIAHQKGDVPKARERLEKALELDPDNEDYLADYVAIEQAEGNHEKVIQICSELLKNVPDSILALNTRGNSYLALNELEKAQADFLTTTRENPLEFMGWNNLGAAYLAGGNIQKAGTSIQKSLELNPNFSDSYILMGNVLNENKDPDRAMQFFDHAVNLEPSNPEAYHQRAQLYLQLDDREMAKADLKMALEHIGNHLLKEEIEEQLANLEA